MRGKKKLFTHKRTWQKLINSVQNILFIAVDIQRRDFSIWTIAVMLATLLKVIDKTTSDW